MSNKKNGKMKTKDEIRAARMQEFRFEDTKDLKSETKKTEQGGYWDLFDFYITVPCESKLNIHRRGRKKPNLK